MMLIMLRQPLVSHTTNRFKFPTNTKHAMQDMSRHAVLVAIPAINYETRVI